MRKSFAALMLLASTAAVQAAEPVKIPVGHAINWVAAKPLGPP